MESEGKRPKPIILPHMRLWFDCHVLAISEEKQRSFLIFAEDSLTQRELSEKHRKVPWSLVLQFR